MHLTTIRFCRRPGGTYRFGFPRRRPHVAQDRWLLRLAGPTLGCLTSAKLVRTSSGAADLAEGVVEVLG
jgi:hypothetical protein